MIEFDSRFFRPLATPLTIGLPCRASISGDALLVSDRRTGVKSGLALLPIVRLCLGFAAPPSQAAGVVGTGTPASCTEAACDAARAGGGTVAFNCGGPATVPITTFKAIVNSTDIQGQPNLQIKLDCGGAEQLFRMTAPNLTLNLRDLDITRCISAGGGGAVYNGNADSSLLMERSGFSNNVGDTGGAVRSRDPLVVRDSTFVENIAAISGGGEGGGTIFARGTTSAEGSTFVGSQMNSGGSFGGDIWADGAGAVVTILNSTFAGGQQLNGFVNHGLAVAATDGAQVTITHATIAAAPTDTNQTGAHSTLYTGLNGASIRLRNTVGGGTAATQAHCVADHGFIVDGGGNLRFGGTPNNSCGASIPVADPLLGGLGNWGGLTDTLPLPANTPALNMAAAPFCPSTDQRGIARPQGAGCDVGAHEVIVAAPITPTAVPTLSAWGLAPLSLLLGAVAVPGRAGRLG